MPLDTALDDDLQERLEQAIRDVIADVSQSEYEPIRDLPGPAGDRLEVGLAPEVAALSIRGVPDQCQLGVDLYLDEKPTGATPLVPDDIQDPAYQFVTQDVNRAPTYLSELGGDYAQLSAALVETLATYCDAPEYAPERVFIGEEADLLCTSCYGPQITFSTAVGYPEWVAAVYADGRPDLARRYGLPY